MREEYKSPNRYGHVVHKSTGQAIRRVEFIKGQAYMRSLFIGLTESERNELERLYLLYVALYDESNRPTPTSNRR